MAAREADTIAAAAAVQYLAGATEPNLTKHSPGYESAMVASERRSTAQERVRVDKWLWAARFFKTRSLAADAVEGGKVRLNGERIKAGKSVRVGDRMSIRIDTYEWALTVRDLSERRGPADVARKLYEEDEASRAARTAAVERRRAGFEPEAEAGGRPEKKQRRELRRLRGW